MDFSCSNGRTRRGDKKNRFWCGKNLIRHKKREKGQRGEESKIIARDVDLNMTDMMKEKRAIQTTIGRREFSLLHWTAIVTCFVYITSLGISSIRAIKLQPEGREKYYWSGEQFVITCQNNNNIKNVKIRWFGPNGLDIPEDKSQRIHAESTGPHGHRLKVMNATASIDDGQYKCTLGSTDDRNPREHIEFDLKLYKTTDFRNTARHLVLAAGQPGKLECFVAFDSHVRYPSVEWLRDQKPIENIKDPSYQVIQYDPGSQSSQLLISSVTRQHDGIYTCRAVAETAQLSKISDHDIQLETQYAPTFDQPQQTVWVERQASQQQQASNRASGGNVYGGAHGATSSGTSGRQGSRSRHQGQFLQAGSSANGGDTTNNGNSQVIRVELRCACQANPPAKIVWTSSQSNYILTKGDYIVEEPVNEINGHNTTSVLVINYNLDPEWLHRQDSYICSAKNLLGEASETFTIQQGDPPPAFEVGPNRHYDPLSSLFQFTLINQSEIVPAVDLFRIRAETFAPGDQGPKSAAATAISSTNPSSASSSSYHSSSMRKQSELYSVTFSPSSHQNNNNNNHHHNHHLQQQHHRNINRHSSIVEASNGGGSQLNYTVNLGQLPSGNQRLFLEAHNAVGWSPNSTYLGEYNIVSGANSYSISMSGSQFQWLFALNLLAYLLISNHRIHNPLV